MSNNFRGHIVLLVCTTVRRTVKNNVVRWKNYLRVWVALVFFMTLCQTSANFIYVSERGAKINSSSRPAGDQCIYVDCRVVFAVSEQCQFSLNSFAKV